eukprot:6208347-Pleurochrysis_carterae.AAC.3
MAPQVTISQQTDAPSRQLHTCWQAPIPRHAGICGLGTYLSTKSMVALAVKAAERSAASPGPVWRALRRAALS